MNKNPYLTSSAKTNAHSDTYQLVTDRIIAKLEAGTITGRNENYRRCKQHEINRWRDALSAL